MTSPNHGCLNCQYVNGAHGSISTLCPDDSGSFFEPVTYCAACHDVQVDRAPQVCNECRNSDVSDWVDANDYRNMLQMVMLQDYLPIALEAAAVRQYSIMGGQR